jgi:hypothetical protein
MLLGDDPSLFMYSFLGNSVTRIRPKHVASPKPSVSQVSLISRPLTHFTISRPLTHFYHHASFVYILNLPSKINI